MESPKNVDFVVSAPGKVILFGEHSVVYKKAAVSTAISRRLYVKVSIGKTNRFCVKLPQLNIEVDWNLNDFQKVLREKCPLKDTNSRFSIGKPDAIDYDLYIKSLNSNLEYLQISTQELSVKSTAALLGILFVFRGILHNVSDRLFPITITINSDLEVGAGTGSSAAFAVAMVGSVLQLRKILDPESSGLKTNLSPVHNSSEEYPTKMSNFSIEELKTINKWAFCIEKIMHGHPSGIDNTTSTYGSVVVATEKMDDSGELEFTLLENNPKISILLLFTGVSRNTLGLAKKVRSLRDSNFAAVEAILNAMDVIALEAVNILRSMGSCNETQNTEMYDVLSGLMELNHGLLRTLGVSHESLEHIVSLTKTFGLSSKLTGAGGGGCAITLLPPNYLRNQVDKLIKELGPPFSVAEIHIAEEGVRVEQL